MGEKQRGQAVHPALIMSPGELVDGRCNQRTARLLQNLSDDLMHCEQPGMQLVACIETTTFFLRGTDKLYGRTTVMGGSMLDLIKGSKRSEAPT